MSRHPAAAGYFAGGLFGRDLVASFVVFLVALPLCMGIAIASGMPPAAGLVSGIVGGLVVGWLAGSPLQVSGPAAGLVVLVFELVRQHGAAMLGPVVLLAGAIQLAAGLCRVGIWFRMTAPAVVAGMLSGIGILIVASQAHVLMDAVPRARGLENFAALPGAVRTVVETGQGAQALLVGLATLVILVAWEKLRPRRLRFLPGALVAVVTMAVLVQRLGWQVKTVEVPSDLLSSLNLLQPSNLAGLLDPALVLAALSFAFIASAETLLSASAVDRLHHGPRTQYNRELMAQGAGNVLCGVLGALPITGVIVRSAANVQAGAATRFSVVLHGAWLLVFAALLPALLKLTPVTCLAAILVYTGAKMINIGQIRELARFGRGVAVVYVATTASIVFIDLLAGVLIGFVLSLLRLSLHASRLDVRLHAHDQGPHLRLSLSGAATFLGVPAMLRTLEQVPPNRELHVDIDELHHVDHACLELLREWDNSAPARGCRLVVDWQGLRERVEGAPQPAAGS